MPDRSSHLRTPCAAAMSVGMLLLVGTLPACGNSAPALDGTTTCQAYGALSDADQTTAVTRAMQAKGVAVTPAELDRTKATVKAYCAKHDAGAQISSVFLS